jgi:hypothetical protein
MSSKYCALGLALIITLSSQMAFAQPASSGGDQLAMGLYSQHKYAAAAVEFEKLIHAAPSARLCYYAALANRASSKEMRARQLFQYVVTSYPRSLEAGYAQQALAQMQPAQQSQSTASSSQGGGELPESVKNMLPPEMRGMLNSPMGKKAIEQVLKDKASEIATIRQAEQKGLLDNTKLASATRAAGINSPILPKKGMVPGTYPFSAQDIAKDGAAGIDQTRYPNCWFESSMAALAQLPRGQRLLSQMIRVKDAESYVVRFPGDAVEYVVSNADLNGITDKAAWASIIEAAQIQKFPDNEGAQGKYGDQSRLEIGLGCITGCKAEVMLPSTAGVQELSSFIGGAIKSQNPLVCGTFNDAHIAALPEVVIPLHAYTIIGLDQSRNMITLRNPHGHKSQRFSLASDPQHLEFEQLPDGVFKLSIPMFQKYFYSVARSFI